MNPRYSVVIPFYNEAGNVQSVLTDVYRVLATLDGIAEVVLIDDGSVDDTFDELAQATAGRADSRIIRFPQNRGQAAALFKGLHEARGDLILTLDGDGQNDPADLVRLLPIITGGQADLVCGIRTPRHDSRLRRTMSRVANAVRRRLLCDQVRDAGCQLRVFRREVIASLVPSPLMQSFLPAMAVAAGFRVTEMPVRHHPRKRGQSKYGFGRLWWRPAVEMIRLRRLLSARKRTP